MMIVLLGDAVTISRTTTNASTIVSGQISGIVLDDAGELLYFFIKGIDGPFWLNNNWRFEAIEDDEEYNDEEEEN